MANSLNRNARLQQENYFLSIQQERYTNLCNAIEETRQARHDIRHHFLQLSSMAEAGDLETIKEYLYNVTQKIPTMHMHFCENQVIDSVISYYCALAERNTIPFHVQIDLPAQISVDETDFCLVLSNLLENALEASLKTAKFRQRIDIKLYRHASNLILIQIENAFDGKIQQNHGIFFLLKKSKMASEFNLSATLLKRLAVDVISRMIMEYLQLKLCFVLVSIHKFIKEMAGTSKFQPFLLSYSSSSCYLLN